MRYEPGELKVVAYKKGEKWAEDVVETTGKPTHLEVSADRNEIQADGKDLAFITIRVADSSGVVILNANNLIQFTIKGNGIIVATDNGDPTDFVPFPSHKRKAFNGLSLAIIRSKSEATGAIILTAKSLGLKEAQVVITSMSVECIFYFDHIEKKY